MSDEQNPADGQSTRRAFLAKIAAYGAPIVLGGQFLGFGEAAASTVVGECSGFSRAVLQTLPVLVGSESASGGETQGESSGGSGGSGNTPHESLLADLDTLKSLGPSSSAAGRQLAGAIRLLTHATADGQWTGGYTLARAHGPRVFTDLAMTAAMLLRTAGI